MRTGLYSKNQFLLDAIQSLISGSRIFTGNQPDDLSIGCSINSGNRVLILGTGFGAAIRSTLAGIPNAKITVVDYDKNVIESCSSLYKHLFPTLDPVTYVYGDASKIDSLVNSTFDLIYVDLYSDTHCPDFVLEEPFWNIIRLRLAEKGSIVANTWGLPTHLFPYDANTPQARMIQLLARCFKNLYAFPFRRNITLVASQTDIQVKEIRTDYQLHELDRAYFDFFPLRWMTSHKISTDSIDDKCFNILDTAHREMDEEMRRRSTDWISFLNVGMKEFGYPSITSNMLKEITCDSICAQNITEWLLDKGSYEASFIPNLVCSYAFTDSRGLEWYPKWIFRNYNRLVEKDKFWFFNIAMVQLLSIVNNPYTNRDGTSRNEIERDTVQLVQELKSRYILNVKRTTT
ncbi:hypothetical protein SAMN04487866_1234 [Thermoactinomyces sp. DSM 45891]|uniref:spermidine synthase n=1 Tax=Thermoactinomyces sp. DSM 45891 TaxID=1761907 RepID=UPI00091EC201|nr:hypothetical protein [Thermoactinomyces sp. DSM 45891]SFX75922.1 hypothetical protein SAMN04487866_1234 [Thermoactinomyces sp. DSM 45891]